uniref:Uncharacterized protein n=1 Tax=Rhizophora mucronata TaxID=61149 RepID=A0A2P2PZJ4_RHIMU
MSRKLVFWSPNNCIFSLLL